MASRSCSTTPARPLILRPPSSPTHLQTEERLAVESSQVVRELFRYLTRHPDEEGALLPLYDAIREHVHQRRCLHEGRCPVVTAGALVVDEKNRLLRLWSGAKWAFVEGLPESDDESLSATATRSLMEHTGIFDVWRMPDEDLPILIDVDEAPAEYGPRMRFGFRYIFRAHSEAISRPRDPLSLRWVSVTEVSSPQLRAALHTRFAAVS
ncbi:NUDIX domain-containing protein [Streptomyces decoyicus]|uniref:NUDIX domain-containing protein n=1 Tax=Streptomyces decoyicus TaxID=249567 RepID=UPI0036434727